MPDINKQVHRWVKAQDAKIAILRNVATLAVQFIHHLIFITMAGKKKAAKKATKKAAKKGTKKAAKKATKKATKKAAKKK